MRFLLPLILVVASLSLSQACGIAALSQVEDLEAKVKKLEKNQMALKERVDKLDPPDGDPATSEDGSSTKVNSKPEKKTDLDLSS